MSAWSSFLLPMSLCYVATARNHEPEHVPTLRKCPRGLLPSEVRACLPSCCNLAGAQQGGPSMESWSSLGRSWELLSQSTLTAEEIGELKTAPFGQC